MTIQSLYTFGNAANVSANNFTTLYNSGAGIVNPQVAYGNANVVGLLAEGTDGGNTIGNIVATGNISGSYFLGNGAFLTGLPETYSNVNVAAYLASGADTANIITTGNISGAYIFGNGSQLTGLPQQYGNANVAAFLPTYTGNLAGGNIAITKDGVVSGNITTGQNLTTGGYIQSAGNIRTTGAAGNITGAQYISSQYYLGDGGLLSNITAVNVGTLTTLSVTGNAVVGNLITTGNVSGNYILGNGALLTGLPATYSNANVAAYLPTYTGNLVALTGNVITTANISGAYILGNGSQLTGLPTQYSNANVAAYLPVYTGNISAGNISAAGNITVSGNLVSDDITSSGVTVYGDQVITGNLTVQGNTTTINSNVITTNDKNITVANNQSTQANVDGAGLDAGNPAVATWRYNAATNSWQSNISVTPIANLSQDLGTSSLRWATIYAGSESLSGNVNAAYFVGNGSTLSSLTGANVTGTVANATYATSAGSATTAATVTANAQPNITSVGTLTSVTSTGNITGGNILTGGLISAAANITGAYFVGNGYTLTSVNASNVVGNVTSALNASTLRIPVKNATAGTLTAGTPIYATGTVGATDTLEIAASRADTAGTMAAIGLLETTLAANDLGYAVSIGALSSLDTSVYTVGQELYVAAGGGLTASRPTGSNVVQTVGTVGRVSASTGTVEVNIWNKNSLPNLSNGNIWQGNATGYPTEVTPYGNANVANYLASGTNTANIVTTGNIGGGNISVSGVVYADGNIGSASNLNAAGASVTGNIRGANVIASANISATGNITGSYFFGNGSQLTGLPATYGNANVAAYLPTYTGNLQNVANISGNINTIIRVGTPTTGTAPNALASGMEIYSNSLIWTDRGSSRLYANGNTWQLIANTDIQLNASDVYMNTANLTVDKAIVATGNITGSYFFGNGSQLTGLPATYSNSNVATFLAAYGSNTISSTGNITTTANIAGGYILGNGSQLTGITAVSTSPAFANIYVAGQSNVAAGNVSGSFTLVAGSNMTITTDAPNNKITLASSGGGGGGTLSGNLAGDIYANGYSITSLANGNVSITANGTGLVNIAKANFQSYREVYYSAGNQTGNLAANIDIANGTIQALTLTGNVTMNTLPTMATGQNITLILTQDATGNRILTSTMKYAGAYKTLSTAASATDILTVFYDGTNYWASLNIGYA